MFQWCKSTWTDEYLTSWYSNGTGLMTGTASEIELSSNWHQWCNSNGLVSGILLLSHSFNRRMTTLLDCWPSQTFLSRHLTLLSDSDYWELSDESQTKAIRCSHSPMNAKAKLDTEKELTKSFAKLRKLHKKTRQAKVRVQRTLLQPQVCTCSRTLFHIKRTYR